MDTASIVQRLTTYRAYTSLLLLVLIALTFGRPANAGVILDEPILGGRLLVAEDGYVTAEFLGSNAGHFNVLYFEGPGGDQRLFDKKTPLSTAPVTLGWFTAGTELILRLDDLTSGYSFYSGDAVRNPDNLAHALAITTIDTISSQFVTTVGFEDLLGGGDLDFNDFEVRLTNVIDPPVPLPSSLALLFAGLLATGTLLRSRFKRQT